MVVRKCSPKLGSSDTSLRIFANPNKIHNKEISNTVTRKIITEMKCSLVQVNTPPSPKIPADAIFGIVGDPKKETER